MSLSPKHTHFISASKIGWSNWNAAVQLKKIGEREATAEFMLSLTGIKPPFSLSPFPSTSLPPQLALICDVKHPTGGMKAVDRFRPRPGGQVRWINRFTNGMLLQTHPEAFCKILSATLMQVKWQCSCYASRDCVDDLLYIRLTFGGDSAQLPKKKNLQEM